MNSPRIDAASRLVGEVQIDAWTVVEDMVLLDAGSRGPGRIEIGRRCKVKRGATIRAYDGIVSIGNRVSIGEHCVVYGHGGVSIAENVIIAPFCVMAASEHIFDSSEIPVRFQGEIARGIDVGPGAWIGTHAVILDGVTIGAGAVIGAGAIVADNAAAGAVVVGVPGKPMKYRTGL